MSFHVAGVGWVYSGDDLLPVLRKPDPVPEAYEAMQARMDVYRERCRLERERERTPEPWPEPEIPMRVVAAGAAPNAPARLLSALKAGGWRFVVTYARGTLTPARDGFSGRGADRVAKHYPAKVVGSWAIRAARGPDRAVAFWHESGGKLSAQAVLRWGDAPARWIGMQEFERSLVMAQSAEEKVAEMADLAESAGVLTHAAVVALRESGLIPTPAQFARAAALREAREVYMAQGLRTGNLNTAEVEALALRWAALIETGSPYTGASFRGVVE